MKTPLTLWSGLGAAKATLVDDPRQRWVNIVWLCPQRGGAFTSGSLQFIRFQLVGMHSSKPAALCVKHSILTVYVVGMSLVRIAP